MTGLVKEKQSGARFKLDALVDAAFKPMQQLLGKKRWMLSDERASSLDCLALGYLSLALVPDMPQPWLTEGLRGRYPDLCKYAKDGAKEVFGGKVTLEDALPTSTHRQSVTTQGQSETTLPWRVPSEQKIAVTSACILNSALDSVPFYKRTTTVAPSPIQPPPSLDATPPHTLTTTLLPPLLASAGAVAAIIASYFLYSGLGTQQESEKKRRLSDMGEAGAVFAGLDFGRPEEVVSHVPVGLEVDVDGASEVRKL